MLPYKNLITIDKQSAVPVYRQLALQFIQLIQEGKLLPDTVLPSTRALALDLQLHRKTIMAAYNMLVGEDWVDNQPRKGYTVTPRLPVIRPRSYNKNSPAPYKGASGLTFRQLDTFALPTPPDASARIIIDDGFPDIALLPTEAIIKEYKKVLDSPVLNDISAGWYAEGIPAFRRTLSTFLNETRGLDINIDNLFTTRGAQMAIYVAASLIIRPGDKVVVGEPSYFIANTVFEQLGAQLIRVPVDQYGMCTETLEEIIQQQDIKLLYVIPHHHHPTTVTMSADRRKHLLQLIRTYRLAVIEDDYDYDFQFQYDPYLPLASGDHGGHIIYIGSLTKVLGTPFRLGYMVATADFLAAAAKLRALIDLRGDLIMEQVAAGLIENGDLERHIKKTNRVYAQRCELASELLVSELGDEVQFSKPGGGMALWLRFKSKYPVSKLVKRAAMMGLLITGTVYGSGKEARYNALRFGFASLEEEKIKEAVHILKKVMDGL